MIFIILLFLLLFFMLLSIFLFVLLLKECKENDYLYETIMWGDLIK